MSRFLSTYFPRINSPFQHLTFQSVKINAAFKIAILRTNIPRATRFCSVHKYNSRYRVLTVQFQLNIKTQVRCILTTTEGGRHLLAKKCYLLYETSHFISLFSEARQYTIPQHDRIHCTSLKNISAFFNIIHLFIPRSLKSSYLLKP